MSERPSVQEIAAFLADIRASRTADAGPADLLARKADLLERIAEAMPGDAEAAEVARTARAAADEAGG
ncbi:hypothetical protein KBZ10_00630 [Streptomyces sp. F63]|uniref:hypothetical protein n=1 Tax=Streptomyces sp. F63 TaxID=2824887 RepID=UPI001B381717|nr:hypothetical protein [Streptomyces sp. F63]MBQ0983068.1 hypothetical protein [Streptomyces sp. F63]